MKKIFKKREYHFDFMRQAKWGYLLSALMLVVSVASLIIQGLNYGIDFEGGVQIEASSTENIKMNEVRKNLGFLKGLTIQTVGLEGKSVLILAQPDENLNSNQLLEKIKSTLGPTYSYQKVEIIGPAIGRELKNKSLLASILALLAITIYIWFRFEWPFAIGCLLALAYDMVVVVGVLSLFQIEFKMVVVAGLLSFAGYDCNDSIVTYDRIREYLKKYRKMPVLELLNKGINETLSRTILTSLTTLFVVLVLLFFGGKTLFGFALAMTLGTVLGTYSSIYLAVPVLQYFDIKKLGDRSSAEPDFNKE